MLRISRISDYSEFRNYKDSWGDLLSRSGIDNIFLTYEWIDACIRYFCKGQRLLILNVFKGDRLVGIAPLMIRRYKYFGLPVRAVFFIGTIISDRMDFILDGHKKESIALIMDYLIDMKSDWDFIDLQEIAEHTDSREIIEAWLKGRKLLNIIGPSTKSFFIEFNENKDYFYETSSKGFNAGFKKIKKKDPDSNAEFKRYINKDIETEKLFSVLTEIERHSWKAERQSGIFSKEDSWNFQREIFDKFSKNKWLDLSILSLNKRPIAYVYNYLYARRSYNYSIAFDKRYSKLSPGTTLMWWVLRDSLARDILEFDFARGEGSWKRTLTQDFKVHNRVRIFRNGLYGRFLYCLQSRVMPYMKGKKNLHGAWMKIKEKIGWQ
ncbi:MAG: GNAT family N-acetyltransferase [Candidatus Omnitrophica bacterium]|nr:GNAT family N-acetyltransferase [Candidatus Omnitrophota bacterium]